MPLERIRTSRSFLHEFIEAVPGAVYAKDCEGRILLGNAGFAEAVGWPQGGFIGKSDLELLADETLARTVMENDRQILAGRARRQVEEILRDADGSTSYWLSTKAPFTDDSGEIAGLVGVSINITERKRMEQRERLLAREIEHRNKNLLSVVQSIVQLTQAPTPEAFRQSLIGRLEALSRAQRVRKLERRQQVDLRTLMLEELAAYDLDDGARLRCAGPPVSLLPGMTQPLAMVFHELATNAAKYGAFAEDAGSLDLNWSRSEGGGLRIEWREATTLPVQAPARHGFGTRLIRTLVEQQLNGTLAFDWQPAGLCCLITIPPMES